MMHMPQLHARQQLIAALAPSVQKNLHQLNKCGVFSYLLFYSGSVRTVNYTLVVLARKNHLAAIHEILKMGQFWSEKYHAD